MISIDVHPHGKTTTAPRAEPAWLEPDSDVFRFHPLSVEDAPSALHHPKI